MLWAVDVELKEEVERGEEENRGDVEINECDCRE